MCWCWCSHEASNQWDHKPTCCWVCRASKHSSWNTHSHLLKRKRGKSWHISSEVGRKQCRRCPALWASVEPSAPQCHQCQLCRRSSAESGPSWLPEEKERVQLLCQLMILQTEAMKPDCSRCPEKYKKKVITHFDWPYISQEKRKKMRFDYECKPKLDSHARAIWNAVLNCRGLNKLMYLFPKHASSKKHRLLKQSLCIFDFSSFSAPRK